MPKKVEGYEAIFYTIDCKRNDSVDIKCGGPPYLGFDFSIDAEIPEEEVITKLRELLEKVGHPVLSVRARDKRIVEKLWTWEAIEKCIKETKL